MKYSLMKRQSERVEAGACGNSGKPPAREPCHGDCLMKSWQYSAWSQVWLEEAASPVQHHIHQWKLKIEFLSLSQVVLKVYFRFTLPVFVQV